MNELSVAISLLEKILGNEDTTAEALSELYEIKQGNKKVILEHLKAIVSIFSKAIDYLESKENNNAKD